MNLLKQTHKAINFIDIPSEITIKPLQLSDGSVAVQFEHDTINIPTLDLPVPTDSMNKQIVRGGIAMLIAATLASYSLFVAEHEQATDGTESTVSGDSDISPEHNIFLIDSIIQNTLTQSEDIQPHTADTLLKLAALRESLVGASGAA